LIATIMGYHNAVNLIMNSMHCRLNEEGSKKPAERDK
jgi:hypothetical protein